MRTRKRPEYFVKGYLLKNWRKAAFFVTNDNPTKKQPLKETERLGRAARRS